LAGGSDPPRWGSLFYSTPPDPLAGFNGGLLLRGKGRGRKKGEGRREGKG